MAAAADGSEIAVLVCSANVGNKEPTPASFGEWVPLDGEIDGPLAHTKYPVAAEGTQEVTSSLRGKGKKFDIIVLGMQEAAFVEKSVKKKSSNGESEFDESTSERDAIPIPVVDDVFEAATAAVAVAEKEGKRANKRFGKAVGKVNLLVRGLTTSQTYKAPAVKRSSGMAGTESKIVENSAIRSGAYDTRKFVELIGDRCPSYELVVAKLRGEMRLVVLARKGLAEEISDVYIAGENTGIGSVLANKGGIIATLTLRGTRLSFMTCHLEAHEGDNHYINRNKNLAEIFAGAKTDPNYNLQDATIISHHMFVCGDLNYRIRFGDSDGTKKKNNRKNNKLRASFNVKKQMTKKLLKSSSTSDPKGAALNIDEILNDKDLPQSPPLDDKEAANPANGSHFTLAKSLVDAEDWKALNDGDELAMALEKKECLVGFKTLPCNFPPTFKVARGEGYQYNEKRTPSYTDRILWKSADAMSDNVVPFLYEPCPDFITSDHKPIRGGYVVKMNRARSDATPAAVETSSHHEPQIHLIVSDIRCTNLPVMDSEVMGGLSDPYILFVSYPKPMLWKKGWPSTKIIHRELNPVWEEDIHLALDGQQCKDGEGNLALNGSMLYMTVMDSDMTSGDDVIGCVALNLSALCSDLDMTRQKGSSNKPAVQKTDISRPILRNGIEFGEMTCTISAAYLAPKDVKQFLKSAKKVRSKTRGTSVTNRIFELLPF